MPGFADNQIATTATPGGYVSKQIGVGFYNNSVLLPLADQSRQGEFGMGVGGSKTGNKIYVKYPAQFKSTDEVSLTAGNTNAIEQQTKELVMDQNVVIPFEISIEQVTLEMDKDGGQFAEDILQPVGAQQVADIEYNGFELMGLEAQNVTVMEDPYADEDALRKEFIRMNGYLNQQLAPEGDRCVCTDSVTEIEVANSQITFFHNQAQVDLAMLKGKMDESGGLKWRMSELVATRVNGAGGVVGATISSYTAGTDTMVLAAAVSGDLDDLAVGDKMQFPSNFFVNAQKKSTTGRALTRAVKSVTGSGATVTVTLDPIYGPASTGAKQNVDVMPLATEAVTVLGTAGETYRLCPVWQKKGLHHASANLELPEGTDMAKRNKVNGCITTFVRDYDGTHRKFINRADYLGTWDLIRAEWIGVLELKIS